MSIDWEKPLEVYDDEWVDVKVIREPGQSSDTFVVESGDRWYFYDESGKYLLLMDESYVWRNTGTNYPIRNKEEYDVKVNIEIDDSYQNALSKTTAELEKQKKLMEEIKELQKQINELKSKEQAYPYRWVPYYPIGVPDYTPPYSPTVFTSYGTTSDGSKK